jgi:hypothetical protein
MIKIPLSKNGKKNKGKYFAIVDDCDADLLSKNWTVSEKIASRTQYAHNSPTVSGRQKRFYLHQIISARHLGPRPKNKVIDHINNNGLDNRRLNLRYVDNSTNVRNAKPSKRNSSGFAGVTFSKKLKLWKSCLYKDNRELFLGYSKCKAVAIAKRILAERSLNE